MLQVKIKNKKPLSEHNKTFFAHVTMLYVIYLYEV